MARLELAGVGKRFGRTQAIDDLSLDVADGEFVVLLGPTGAGKTTTLRLVAGLETPDCGRVAIGGRDMSRAAIAERDVAFVFQQYSLYPHYSVYDNLAFPLRSPEQRRRRQWSEPQIRDKVHQIARLLRIEPKLNNRATALSGGEMQRVAIGRALVRTPAAFLMDEPLSSLDAKLREDLRAELKRIQSDLGATVLYVTHDQIEAMTLADRIGVLSEGRLVQLGPPREVYTRPDSIYVAQRLGSPPINLLPPTLLALPAPPGTARIGLRPEDLTIDPVAPGSRPPTAPTLTAEVLQVEHLGAETVIVLRADAVRLHVLHSALPPTPGRRVRLGARAEAALYFDADGRRLTAGGRA